MAVGIPVGEVMRKAVVTVNKNMTIDKVAKIMDKADIGSVVVREKGKIIGILAEGDIIKKAVAHGKDCKKMKVGSIMVHPVRTIPKKTDIEDAAKIMRDLEITRLPVVEKNKLVGIITERDLVMMEPALLELMVEKGNLEQIGPAHKDVDISGYCENCGNYSDNLRYIDSRFVCDDCRRL